MPRVTLQISYDDERPDPARGDVDIKGNVSLLRNMTGSQYYNRSENEVLKMILSKVLPEIVREEEKKK